MAHSIEVIRSAKRRKTVQARFDGGVIKVFIPARFTKAEEERYVADLVDRLVRKQSAGAIDVAERARALAAQLQLPEPTSIRWVDNQSTRWGSCTPAERSVRLSSRLTAFPRWVIDYVIVHELAHLVEANHSPTFWALVDRYPLAERARGYLMAKGADDHEPAAAAFDGERSSAAPAQHPGANESPRRAGERRRPLHPRTPTPSLSLF